MTNTKRATQAEKETYQFLTWYWGIAFGLSSICNFILIYFTLSAIRH